MNEGTEVVGTVELIIQSEDAGGRGDVCVMCVDGYTDCLEIHTQTKNTRI